MLQVPVNRRKNHYLTLLLLCVGYFIDFYDLTIMGVSYNELIQEQFHINSVTQIQQTYLLISNFQTIGIFIGAILFGVLGDKIGRAAAIKYSILLYSISTILAVYTHSLPLFIALRTLAYIGLASEFSTSTVLILELFPFKSAAWGTAILYSFGVLGGITATSIGIFSWKAMFLVGGGAGFLLYLGRRKLHESHEFLYAKRHSKAKFGSIMELIGNRTYGLKLIKYFCMITPYFAMITMMFIFPNYMIKSYSLGYATKLLLLGFFFGNILSSLLSAFFLEFTNNYKPFMLTTLLIFLILMLNFRNLPESAILIYSMGLGLIGGGYPLMWAQQIAQEYPIHIRNLASNLLFAFGRGSSILFNIMISSWLTIQGAFVPYAMICSVVVYLVATLSILLGKQQLMPTHHQNKADMLEA